MLEKEKGIKKIGSQPGRIFDDMLLSGKKNMVALFTTRLKGWDAVWTGTGYHSPWTIDYYKAVIKVFVDLYNKGSIYRGARMINWDPAAKTALSDEEVEYREVARKTYIMFHIK